MSRTYPLIIVLAAALVAAVGCGDDAPDVLEPHTEAGTEALRVKVPIDVRFFVDDAIDVTPDGVTLDNVIDPREAALEVRDYDVFDVSGVEFTEGGWGLSRVCETAFLKANAAATANARHTCRATEHRLAWAEFLTVDNVTVSDTDYGCVVKLTNWYVCH